MAQKLRAKTVPIPPFWGARMLTSIQVADIIPYIHLPTLYRFHWGINNHDQLATSTLQQLIAENNQQLILQPQAVYGYFPGKSDGNNLIIYENIDTKKEACRFSFPRQTSSPNLCLADFFCPITDQETDLVILQLVTIGPKAADFARALFTQNEYQKYLFWRGFNVAVTEGLAEFVHRKILQELGLIDKNAASSQHYGTRFSLGFPACPNLEDQQKIIHLLEAQKIGVSLSETFQLLPEESTSAIVIHNPQSKHFFIT